MKKLFIIILALIIKPTEFYFMLKHCYEVDHKYDLEINNFRFKMKCADCNSEFLDEIND